MAGKIVPWFSGYGRELIRLANAGEVSVSEVTVASATTCDILGAASSRVAISGTTTITSLGTGANKIRFVRFTGALLLTHNVTSLILPGAANITTAAGDTCIVASDGSSNARVFSYQKASGLSAANRIDALDAIGIKTEGDVSVADDAVGIVAGVPLGAAGLLIVTSNNDMGLFMCETIGTVAITTIYGGSTVVNGGVGTPGPGAGTNGKMNIYINSSGVVRVSNRLGATATFGGVFIGASGV